MITAHYEIDASDVEKAAMALAVGQSVGNPDIRALRDSDELLARHQARVIDIEGGRVTVEFPGTNFGESDGIAHIMAVLLGGQVDIDHIEGCRLVDVDFGDEAGRFSGPRYGIEGIRQLTGAIDRPLIGGIVKPKLGLSPRELADVCREMADGGVDFIKEDEVLGDPPWCPLADRVPAVVTALDGMPTIYAPCVTGDALDAVRRATLAYELGASAIHVNVWSGFGTFRAIREQVELPLFFQKSGDRVWTTGHFAMSEVVLYKIVRLMGCDMAHVGMWGGYLNESISALEVKLGVMRGSWIGLNTLLPSFSCGAHPGLVRDLGERFGNDIMISSGGAIHGHPMGTTAGARAFRQAIDPVGTTPELDVALELWGGIGSPR
ncbi:ribulose-bisphosphate carboxylase large subunit family protein [Nonomuraea rosea]|uniref:Ribulose-bisphosphate carboxylase large subunit family protein n=1 Tax=Nonomuraea rosea TaxID=638574 RepID=A0ABP7A0D1_9ACTN